MAQNHNADYSEKPMTTYGRTQGPSRRYRRLRHPTFPAAEWTAKNPLLQRGEIGIESDTHKAKVGDGTTYWNTLPYFFVAETEWGYIVGDINDQTDLIELVDDKVAAEAGLRSDADDGLQDQITDNKDTMDDHIANTNNPHNVTASQVGLGNVDNTSDADKPISTATQDALDLKANIADLGTAAYTDSTDYATAAQGTKADSALQPGDNVSDLVNDAGYLTQHQTLADLGITATASEINVLDGITASTTELNYVDGVTGAIQTQLDNKQNTLTAGSNITITGTTISATDTTYTGSDGITLTGTNFTNSGVRAVASGTANGTISVNTNGTSADVAVTGLGSAAYTSSSDYATSAQGGKADTAVQPGDLATVATTGDYTDLLNKPTIPAGQVNSDWNANSGVAQILNKPTIPTVNNPTITITQGGVTKGSFTLNQATGDTIALDAGGGGSVGKYPLNEHNISNCITNIPQDIKLEFDTTTKVLTLKAGSKLYIPNGSGVFNEITINSDQTLTNTFSGQYNAIFVCWDSANNVMRQTPTVNSGTSDPSTASNRIWYDTTANKIKYYENAGTTVTSDSLSLPICIMQNAGSGGGFTKIQQVFNGFGYIGSSTFVLPGVKGLIPNGRNADGTCNNIELNFTTPTVLTLDYSNETSILCFLTSAGIRGYGVRDYYEQDTEPVFSGTYATWFNIKDNIMYLTSNGGTSWSKITDIWLGYMGKSANANITSFSPKCSLSLLDYNSKPEIVAWGRQFVSANTTIAQGDGGIAGLYNLGFKTIDTVRIGVFQASLRTTQAGYSSIAISTDVVTSPCLVAGTNNQFANDGTITIPFINSVTISFPTTNGGIGTGTKLVFKGYM